MSSDHALSQLGHALPLLVIVCDATNQTLQLFLGLKDTQCFNRKHTAEPFFKSAQLQTNTSVKYRVQNQVDVMLQVAKLNCYGLAILDQLNVLICWVVEV